MPHLRRSSLLAVLVCACAAVPAGSSPVAEYAPAHGHYVGHAPHHGNYSVTFTLVDGKVDRWLLDGRILMPTTSVNPHDHHFTVTRGNHYLEGHWTSAHTAVGVLVETRRRANRDLVKVPIEWIAHLQAG